MHSNSRRRKSDRRKSWMLRMRISAKKALANVQMNTNESIAEGEWESGPRQIIEFSDNQTDRRNTG